MVAEGDGVAAVGGWPAGCGPHPGEPGDQAAIVSGGYRRPVLAASDTALVRPRRAYAYSLPVSLRSGGLCPGRSASAGGWMRCHAAMVVRPVGRTGQAVRAVQAAARAGRVQGDSGGRGLAHI